MKFATDCREADAGTLPPFLLGNGPLVFDDEKVNELVEIAISDTGAVTGPITVGRVLPQNLKHDYPIHRPDEVRIVNSTCVRRSWVQGAYWIGAAVPTSPEATVPSAVPEVRLAVPDLLEGYEEYAEPNWDCYGSEPISSETVEAARQLLAVLPNTLGEPHIAPGPDGTIGLEWVFRDRPLRKLYIDVGPGCVWSGYWRRTSGEKRAILPKPIDARTEAELGKLFAELST